MSGEKDTSILWIETEKTQIGGILGEFELKASKKQNNYKAHHEFYIKDAISFVEEHNPNLKLIISNILDGNTKFYDYLPQLASLKEQYPQAKLLIVSEFIHNNNHSKKPKTKPYLVEELKPLIEQGNVYFQNYFSNANNSERNQPALEVLVAVEELLK